MEDEPAPNNVSKCEISDVKFVEDGLKSFVTYYIRSEFSNGTTSVCVRRYSDFEWLQKALEAKFLDVLIPPISEKEVFSRFSHDVVEYRRRQFGRFLNRLISHSQLSESEAFKQFLTVTEEEFSEIKSQGSKFQILTKTDSNSQPSGASSFFSNVLNTVSTMATNIVAETQEIDATFVDYQNSLELSREKLEFLVHYVSLHSQKGSKLVEETVAFTAEVEKLDKYEQRAAPEVSEYLSKYRDIELAIADLLQKKLISEREMFEDTLRDLSAYTIGGERLLGNRFEALKQYQLAQANTKSKLEKDQSSSNEFTVADLKQARENEAQQKDIFLNLSASVKGQIDGHNVEKSKQFHQALRELARENIEFGEQSIALWKEFGKNL